MSPPLLAFAVDGLVAAAKSAAPDVLPPASEIDTQLTSAPATWAAMITHILDGYIDPLFKGLPSTAVGGSPSPPAAPRVAPVAWNTIAQVRKVLADAASLAPAPVLPETNTLPLSKVDVLDYKLHRFQRAGDVLGALDIYVDYIAGGRTLAASLIATKEAARRAVRDLGALEALFIRYSVAINGAAAAGVSLAEALALYRVEGDLVAPLSRNHLVERLPVNEKVPVRNLGTVDTGNVELTLQRGLWSYPFKALASRALGIPSSALPAAGPARLAAEDRTKCFALVHWMLVIGGVDYLSRMVGLPIDPTGFRNLAIAFMNGLRVVRGLASDVPARQAEFDAVFADLTCTWPGDENGRVVVAPNSPILLGSLALTQALLFFSLDHTQGDGPFIEPQADLKYLAYNLQHVRSSVDESADRYIHLLASAAVAAAKSTRPSFASLKSKLAPLGLPSSLPKNPAIDSSDHVAVFELLTAAPSSFLDNSTNSALLADFILRAEGPSSTRAGSDWDAFEKNRGNLARYRKLLAYFSAFLA